MTHTAPWPVNPYLTGATWAVTKKAEFPDAIALLSLDSWGKSKNKKVLTVSADEDWQSFAAQSDHIFCLPDVPKALDHFNREARFIAERTMAFLQEQQATDANNEIANAVERFFDGMTMEVEADANSYGTDATLQGGALQYWTMKDGPLTLAAYVDDITFVVDLDCKVCFEAVFSWSIYSDGEWHSMSHSTTETVERDCTLQFSICSPPCSDERWAGWLNTADEGLRERVAMLC